MAHGELYAASTPPSGQLVDVPKDPLDKKRAPRMLELGVAGAKGSSDCNIWTVERQDHGLAGSKQHRWQPRQNRPQLGRLGVAGAKGSSDCNIWTVERQDHGLAGSKQ